jgi:hypothetical protein
VTSGEHDLAILLAGLRPRLNAGEYEGIGCNVIAGHHHDHLFVPAQRAHDAMATLAERR